MGWPKGWPIHFLGVWHLEARLQQTPAEALMQNIATSKDLAELDNLLEGLTGETEAQCELLREHLESARAYLVGSMPTEYALSLRMADEALNCISNRNLRARIEHFIQNQEQEIEET